MNVHKDQYLINGIVKGDTLIIEKIYKEYSLSIKSYVLKNSGTIEDAQDLFQESIMAIYNMSQKKEIKLTCSFMTYLNAISRRLWWKKLRSKNNQIVAIDEVVFTIADTPTTIEEVEKYEFYQEKLQELKPRKRQLLELYFEGKRMAEITQIMDFKSEGYTRKLKYQCKQTLQKLMQNDARYFELIV